MPIASQVQVFLPVLTLVALTFVALVRMAAGRAGAMKSGQDPDFYRAHLGKPEPEAAAAGARHWDNLFELPTLFYAGCIIAYALAAVGTWTLVFAWGFVAARIGQSLVHMTYNNPAHRGLAFMLGALFVFALWVDLGLAIFAAL